jgi:hypothetical protein
VISLFGSIVSGSPAVGGDAGVARGIQPLG